MPLPSSSLIFADIPDEVLVARARLRSDGPEMLYLLERYSSIVRMRARGYFLQGADREDLIQEGMIGLYKAVRDFKSDKSTFRAFAEMCVTRQIITAIKTATRQKHHYLNHAVSMDKPMENEERTLLDIISDPSGTDPVKQLEKREMSDDVRSRIMEELSPLEQDVLFHYIQGHSYAEISKEMIRGVKSIDNALQRAKRKIGESIIRMNE